MQPDSGSGSGSDSGSGVENMRITGGTCRNRNQTRRADGRNTYEDESTRIIMWNVESATSTADAPNHHFPVSVSVSACGEVSWRGDRCHAPPLLGPRSLVFISRYYTIHVLLYMYGLFCSTSLGARTTKSGLKSFLFLPLFPLLPIVIFILLLFSSVIRIVFLPATPLPCLLWLCILRLLLCHP